MWCPRCRSSRIQRGFDNALIVFRLAGLQKLLCNNCGLEFKGFDPLKKIGRKIVYKKEPWIDRRRAPRYRAHLSATISLVERNDLTWDVAYTKCSRGHCETISQLGFSLSFVGTRFSEEEIATAGSQLFVTVELPDAPIAAVVTVLNWKRPAENGRRQWTVGAAISQMSETDTAALAVYLEKRSQAVPFLPLD